MSGLIQDAIDQLDGMRAQASSSAGGCPELQHSRRLLTDTEKGQNPCLPRTNTHVWLCRCIEVV